MFADLERVAAVLESLPERKVAVAFSGGVDSITLARCAEMILGKENLLLLFADSVFAPSGEKSFAMDWATARKLNFTAVPFQPLAIEQIARNHADRCYHCKRKLFELLFAEARKQGFETLADGENLDDLFDYRPGRKAADELGVRHIFTEAKLTKDMIRDLAHDFALPNSQAPASACLASRIPCNTPLTPAILEAVDKAENELLMLGFAGARVRHYGELAKVEVAVNDLEKCWMMRSKIAEKLRQCNFKFTAIDVAGYQRGAVNGANKKDGQI